MYCIYCGQKLPDCANFCSACGKATKNDSKFTLPIDWQRPNFISHGKGICGHYISIGRLEDGGCFLFEDPEKLISPYIYEEIIIPEVEFSQINDVIYFVRRNDKWGIMRYPCEEISPCIYEDIKAIESPEHYEIQINDFVYLVRRNDKWGVYQYLKKELFPCIYDDAETAEDKYFLKMNGKWCWYKAPAVKIKPFIFEDIDVIYSCSYNYFNFCKVIKNGKYGLYDAEGKEILPCIYDDIDNVIDDYCFKVKINGKYGIVDENKKELLPILFDEIIKDTLFLKSGLAKTPWYSDDYIFDKDKSRCFCLVKDSNKLGVYECFQGFVLPLGVYTDINIDYAPFIIVTKNGKKGLMKDCQEELPCNYDDIEGYINLYGDYPNYIYKYFILAKNNKYGFYEHSKKYAMPCMYDKIDIVSNLNQIYCIVKINNQYGVYSHAIELIPPLYDKITSEHFEYESHHVTIYTATGIGFIVKQHNKVGAFIYNDSVEIIPCLYDDVDFKNYPIIRVRHEGKWLSFNDFDEFKNYISFCNESVNNSKPDNIFDKFLDELFKNLDDNLSSNVFTINNSNANNNIVKDYLPYYLFFDTETTGVPKNYKAPITDLDNWPRLVQLGWILCDDNGNEIETGNDIIKPNGFIIPKAASNVHKITTSMAIANGIDLSQALSKFILASKQAKVLVGHNVSFDINVVGAELLRIQSDYNIVSKASIDTMLKSINYCAIPSGFSYGDKYKWPKLQELHKKLFGYEFEDAHDAMADIRATKKCFFEMKRIGLIIEESRTLDKHPINNSASIDDIPDDDLPF